MTPDEAGAPLDLHAEIERLKGQNLRLAEEVRLMRRAIVSDQRKAEASRQETAASLAANQSAIIELRDHAAAQSPSATAGATDDTALPWMDRATAQQWHDLAAWVDWLGESYEFKETHWVFPCWPAHPGIVEELAALWDAWRWSAGRAPLEGVPAGDNDAMAFWHDRYLAPTIYRLQAMYAFHACAKRHESARPAPRTDMDLLPPLP